MDSKVGLAIQCVGIFLVTLLSFFTMRSTRDASRKYWTVAWACLSVSLSSLMLAFHIPAASALFYTFYFFGEYAFGYVFVAGCRQHAAGAGLTRRHLWAFVPGVGLSALLPRLTGDFNDLFMVHALLMAGLFAAALVALWPARRHWQTSLGLRVMSVALILLTIDFLHYVPIFSARHSEWGVTLFDGYLQYTSIIDLILEILLGFSTIMVLMEGMQREVEASNRELTEARDKLELLARVDPLTEALNRHAFHALLSAERDGGGAAGCVAVVDLDNLKPINDSYGHAAGDKALREVAHAVRSNIRADDLLFRWGGDEFLVLMFGAPEAEARRRLESLNAELARKDVPSLPHGVRVGVSHGLAAFKSLSLLDRAIEQADGEMYRRKQARKKSVEREAVAGSQTAG